jgi:NAD(P)-dependent dehydrogenase (short-subunit alcohol dehydrogenase family)
MLLAGKIAIVTGATSGIGRAIAIEMAAEGAHVIVSGRNRKGAEDAAAEIARRGGKCRAMLGDIAAPEFPGALMADVLAREGRADALVNAAGILFRGTAEACTDAEWEATFAVNVTGLFRMSRAAIPAMRKIGGGSIVNIASDWALVGAHNAAAYGASKGAVAQLTRSMAIDHAKDAIRVNAICPGDTDTPMLETAVQGIDRDARLALLGGAIPLGRVAKPEEIAHLAVFLASDKAAYITGALLPVDGGNTAR